MTTSVGAFAGRLDSAADHVEACRAALEDAVAQRDQVIVAAVEAGWSWGKTAKAARVAKGHLHRILTKSYAARGA